MTKKLTGRELAEDLRESARDYRNPNTSESEREYIRSYWAEQGISNQLAARVRVAEAERNG